MKPDDGWWSETGRWIKAPLLDVQPPRTGPREKWEAGERSRHRIDRWIIVVIRIAVVLAALYLEVDISDLVNTG